MNVSPNQLIGLMTRCASIFVLLLFLSGCASLSMNESAYTGPETMPETKKLHYPQKQIQLNSVKQLKGRPNYIIKEMSFRAHKNVFGQDLDVKITYYQLKTSEPKPLILCLPIMDGKNTVARIFANYYANRGYHAAIVHKQKDMYKELTPANFQEKINLGLEQIIFSHMQALDWFEDQPEIDTNRIGVSGVSMGSIKALLVSAHDPRIKATFAALTGGDLPYILRHSDDGGVSRMRQKILDHTGETPHELETSLRKKIAHDPLLLAPYIDARQVMLVLASEDTTVPIETGESLRQALGKPDTVYVWGTHISSLIYVSYIMEKADLFFHDRLDVPNRIPRKTHRSNHWAVAKHWNRSRTQVRTNKQAFETEIAVVDEQKPATAKGEG